MRFRDILYLLVISLTCFYSGFAYASKVAEWSFTKSLFSPRFECRKVSRDSGLLDEREPVSSYADYVKNLRTATEASKLKAPICTELSDFGEPKALIALHCSVINKERTEQIVKVFFVKQSDCESFQLAVSNVQRTTAQDPELALRTVLASKAFRSAPPQSSASGKSVSNALPKVPLLCGGERTDQLMPVMANGGNVAGFKILATKPGSFGTKIKLQSGDVLTQLNGKLITSPIDVANFEKKNVYKLVRNGAELSISFECP